MDWSSIEYVAWGFLAGCVIALAAWVAAWWRRRQLVSELKQLKQHLHLQMEITQDGSQAKRDEVEKLKKENENLRISVKAWQQKPGREEQRMLQVYDIAVHKLLEGTPGFSLAWEAALKQAESQMAEADTGVIAFAKRLVLPRVSSSPKQLEEKD